MLENTTVKHSNLLKQWFVLLTEGRHHKRKACQRHFANPSHEDTEDSHQPGAEDALGMLSAAARLKYSRERLTAADGRVVSNRPAPHSGSAAAANLLKACYLNV